MTSAARRIDHLIRTDDEYDDVVNELERLIDRNPREGTPADERIAFLSLLVELGGQLDPRSDTLPSLDHDSLACCQPLTRSRAAARPTSWFPSA